MCIIKNSPKVLVGKKIYLWKKDAYYLSKVLSMTPENLFKIELFYYGETKEIDLMEYYFFDFDKSKF